MTDREAALLVLHKVEQEKSYSNIALSVQLEEHPECNRAFVSQLVYGTLERLYTLDYYLGLVSKVKIQKLDPYVRAIMRCAAYQFFFLDRIPESAACNEATELAKKYAGRHASYVNGVLRQLLREKSEFSLPQPRYSKELSITGSVSQSIAQLLIRQYGIARACDILEAFFTRRDVNLCVNTLKISVEKFLESVKEVTAVEQTAAEAVLSISGAGRIPSLPGFEEGHFYIQDLAAYVCAAALGAQMGEKVLDLCAAPGGKSFTCAVGMKNMGKLDAFDLSYGRVRLIRESAARLGLKVIDAKQGDALVLREQALSKYDRILCDVPCSGLGILGKKPDIRQKEVQEFRALPDLQYRILKNGGAYVKPGGTLLYATCTLNEMENGGVVDRFLKDGGFRLLDAWQALPEGLSQKRDKSYCVTLFPDIHGTDGFFMAKFQKNID